MASLSPVPESADETSESVSEMSIAPTKLAKRRKGLRRRIQEHPVRWAGAALFIGALILLGTLVLRPRITEEVNRPLGQALPQFPTPLPPEEVLTDPEQAYTLGTTGRIDTVCDGPPQMVILAVGADTRNSDLGGLADVIRVVRADFVNPSISALTIPRDLWVSIPGLGQYGPQLADYFGYPRDEAGNPIDLPGDYARVNVAYFYGNFYDLPGGGPTVLAQTLYDNLGISVEHYIGIDMEVLVSAIDAVGGIDIVVPYDIEDFKAGPQHMTGEQALAFSRIRNPDNDWYRGERQTLVLLALQQKLKEPQVITRLPGLVDSFLDEVRTDLSKAQITSLICLATQVERTDIHSYAIGPDLVTETYTTRGSFILLPNQAAISIFVTDFFYGTLDS